MAERIEFPSNSHTCIYGAEDKGVPAEQGRQLEQQLRQLGKDVELVIYPEANHAFFNDARKEVYKPDAAQDAWRRTVNLFRQHVH